MRVPTDADSRKTQRLARITSAKGCRFRRKQTLASLQEHRGGDDDGERDFSEMSVTPPSVGQFSAPSGDALKLRAKKLFAAVAVSISLEPSC
jgi:hypothetical protein